MNVSLIIPAKNESKNLPYILPKIPNLVHEIILVDGKSTDGTVEIAKKYRPDIKVVTQTKTIGKGGALIEGFENMSGDVAIIIDADGSMDPHEISNFVKKIEEGYDLVKGSRFIKGGNTEDMTLIRKIGNTFFVILVNLLFKQRFSDLCYGYLAIKKESFKQLNLKSNDFSIETEIILKAVKAKLRIVEIPSYEHKRIHGISNLSTIKDGFSILKTIIKERLNLN